MLASRRDVLMGTTAVALLSVGEQAFGKDTTTLLPPRAKPLPLSAVRLRPSVYATAVEVNRAYLPRLSADRLLHNFMSMPDSPPRRHCTADGKAIRSPGIRSAIT